MRKPPIRQRLVIHAGMHKTGSTSLQHALGMRDIPDVHYVRLGKDNHSTALIELYLQNPRQHFAIHRLGLTDSELQDRKKKLEQRLIRQLNNRPEETFVISGEWLSHAPKPALDALRDAMGPHFTQTDIFCYVRAPGSLLPSIMQQRIKTGGANFELHWPGYRSQMEQLDRAFGRENVHFRLYDAKAFRDGDIVSDFADWTGIPLRAQPQQTRRNTSLSAAALALIGCYRRQQPCGFGHRAKDTGIQ
ncbi:hypothetical protein [Pseudophaeobacter leonis]|uniref:hypothetical protein n=1 Tax=Pseudophaeobacter leonis TaxID=1144477 RepID=UPI00111C569B|nr:hypothetical protein [Pseudophaeobacter leonis]